MHGDVAVAALLNPVGMFFTFGCALINPTCRSIKKKHSMLWANSSHWGYVAKEVSLLGPLGLM